MPTLEIQTKEVLVAIGRAVAQTYLYGPEHPIVAKTIAEAAETLSEALAEHGHEEIVLSLDHESLLVNGRRIGSLKEQSAGLRSLFGKFNLHSVSFLRGLPADDLLCLCRVFRETITDPKTFKLDEWLNEKGVHHIKVNEAFYSKVEKQEDGVIIETGPAGKQSAGGLGQAGAASAAKTASEDGPEQAKDDDPMTAILKRLTTASALSNTGGANQEILDLGMDEMKAEVKRMVNEASKVLLAEIARLENEIKRIQAVLSRSFAGILTVDRDANVLAADEVSEMMLGKKQKDIAGNQLVDLVEPASHLLAIARELSHMPTKPVAPTINFYSSQDIANAMRPSAALIYNEMERVVGLLACPPQQVKIKEYEYLKTRMIASIITALSAPIETLDSGLKTLKSNMTGKMSPDDKNLFEHLAGQNDRLDKIIKSLRDYSQIENGQIKVFKVIVSSYAIIHDAIEMMLPWAKAKNITIEPKQERGLPDVEADPKRSLEVLGYLLSNAIKNSPAFGRIEVAIERGVQKNDGFLVICVSDEGKGVPKGELEKIMREFEHSGADKDGQSGLGLGLTLAKSLIDLQKGKLWIEEREPGKGIKASFTLPVFIPPPDYKPPEKIQAQVQKSWWQKLLDALGIKT